MFQSGTGGTSTFREWVLLEIKVVMGLPIWYLSGLALPPQLLTWGVVLQGA